MMTNAPYFEDIPDSAYKVPLLPVPDPKPEPKQKATGFQPFDADRTIAELEIYREHGSSVLGEQTGLSGLDTVVGRYLRPGSLVTIAADTGAGKSVLGAQLALHVAERGGGVLFWSAEMKQSELHKRLVANTMRTRGSQLELGLREAGDKRWEEVKDEFRRIASLPIRLQDTGESSILDIERMLIEHKQTHPDVRLLVIDYLQLLDPTPGAEKTSEYNQLRINTRQAKRIANTHGVCVILISQLNRNHVDREPRKSDLHGSSSIEKDSDLIVFIHKTGLEGLSEQNRKALEQAGTEAEIAPYALTEDTRVIYTAKNRKGPQMACLVEFFGSQTRFADPGATITAPYVLPEQYTPAESNARSALSELLTL